jgi:hypothetical protein
MIANYELENTRKEAVVAYLKALSPNLPGGTEEKHENYHSGQSLS